MSVPSTHLLTRLLFGLMAAAAFLLSHAWCEASSLTWGHGLAGGVLWCGLGALLLRGLGRRFQTPRQLLLCGASLFLGHALFDVASRRLWGLGSGAEYVLLGGLVNVGFFFLSRDEPRLRRLTLPLSLAVAAFGLSLSHGWLGNVLAAVYLGLVVWALVHMAGTVPQNTRPSALLVAPVLVVFLLGCWLTGGQSTLTLGGLLLGSGGGAESDPFGRGGVGNGEGEVAATQKTEDVGFANTDVVVESEKRTLYDAVNEVYGEPEPPKKLAPKHRKVTFAAKEILEKPKEPMVAPKANKGFSTRRTQGRPAAQAHNEAAKALLYVTGRAPQHLRMVAYERYTNETWHEGRFYPEKDIVVHRGGDWMVFPDFMIPPVFGAQEYHEVKIGTLETDRLPLPPYPREVRIDRIQQSDFYRWAQRGILRLDDVPVVPPGVRIEVRSRALDYRKLFARPIRPEMLLHGHSTYYQLPDNLDPRIPALARQWSAGAAPGWPQVQAIVTHLRQHARHDPSARPPATATEPVCWFLFESRRGNDYLFATAAALMIRSLSYPARVVSGLYVSGKQKDVRTGHHLLFAQDLHFWVEVESEARPNEERLWVLLEPTPGFDTASPLPSLADRLQGAFAAVQRSLRRQALVLTTLAALAFGGWWFRREVFDVLGTLHWHVWARRTPDTALTAALLLLERRATQAGWGRPPGRTLRQHLQLLETKTEAEASAALRAVLTLAEQRLYGQAPLDTTTTIPTLARALRLWSRRRWKALPR